MYQDGADGLIGWIDLDPAVRPPRDNGSRDIEIVLETGALEPGPGQPGPPLPDRLFLDGIRVSEQLLVSLDFDVGDLDQLTLRLDREGAAERVFLTP
jgi:hypothetical protein